MTQKIKTFLLSFGFLFAGLFFISSPALAASQLGNGCAGDAPTAAGQHACLKNNPVVRDIQTIVNFLSAGVAIVIAGSIIVAGIQYTMAGNQPQVLTSARNRIINSVIALFAFLLIFAFLQWVIPGGVFS
jgi:hypothetical protein